MRTRRQLTLTLLAIIGIVVIVNILAVTFHGRFDATEDKEYTLSNATKNILRNLDDVVNITAYFSEDLPPEYAQVRKEFKDMVNEYAALAKGNIAFKFVDPLGDNELEQEAMKYGVRPVLLSVREKDKNEQQKAYLGAVISSGDKSEAIPVIQPKTPFEYTLTTSIKKVSLTNKPNLGFIQGHNEIPMQNLGQLLNEIGFLYNVENVYLSDTTNLLRYKTLVINAPRQPFNENELALLDNFLANGGKLFLNIEHVNADLQSSMELKSLTTGLEGWLTQKGLVIEDDVVIDKHCSNIGVKQQQGMFNMTVPLSFPYLPIITNFAEHPITESLKGVSLMFPSSLQFTGNEEIQFTPIMFTSEAAENVMLPAYIDITRKWSDTDFPMHNIPVAGVLTGSFNNGPITNIVVVADGDYAASQGGQRTNADNVNLMANCIDWLSDDTGLIELRSKGINYRPIDEISDSKKATLKWVNFLLPIVLIILYGIFNWQKKLIKRNKRTEENYVQ